MIIKFPTWQHEGTIQAVTGAIAKQGLKNIRIGGSPDLKLDEGFGIKCPDLVLCDSRDPHHEGMPTVVFEAGFTQTQAALNFNAARLLFGSGGHINAVVNIKLSAKELELEYLAVDVWRRTVVDEKQMTLQKDTILMSPDKIADPQTLSWSFSYLTKLEGDTLHLKTTVKHYEVKYTSNLLPSVTY